MMSRVVLVAPAVAATLITATNLKASKRRSRAKKAHKHKEIPRKSPSLDPTLKILYVGVLLLENKGEEACPHKELGLSNLYAGGPFNSLCGYSLCAFFRPLVESEVVMLVMQQLLQLTGTSSEECCWHRTRSEGCIGIASCFPSLIGSVLQGGETRYHLHQSIPRCWCVSM